MSIIVLNTDKSEGHTELVPYSFIEASRADCFFSSSVCGLVDCS